MMSGKTAAEGKKYRSMKIAKESSRGKEAEEKKCCKMASEAIGGRLAGHGPPKVRYAVAAVLCYYRASMLINISAAAVPSALCRQ